MQTIGKLSLEPTATITSQASLDAAYAQLMAHGTSELWVVDEQQRLIGVLPDYELLKCRLSGEWQANSVATLMSPHVLCYTVDTPMAVAMRDFSSGFRTRAAVVHLGQVIGQLTRASLLRAICDAQSTPVPRPKFYRSELARNASTLMKLAAN